MFSLDDYHYDLPPDLIAQKPAGQRDHSNLLHLDRQTGALSHHSFNEIVNFFKPDDVLVVNDTAVIPGRLEGKKATGGKVEVLISDYVESCKSSDKYGKFNCKCLVKASKRPAPGTWIYFSDGMKAEVLDARNGTHTLKFHVNGHFETLLEEIGQVPLPPYIRRNQTGARPCDDQASYQTVYAGPKGAIAAPTAGLRFTEKLLNKLKSIGVIIASTALNRCPGIMNRSQSPLPAATFPLEFTAYSSVRTQVVPTATTRFPQFFALFIASADPAQIVKGSECI